MCVCVCACSVTRSDGLQTGAKLLGERYIPSSSKLSHVDSTEVMREYEKYHTDEVPRQRDYTIGVSSKSTAL